MAYAGKPVTLTAGSNPGTTAPQPLIVVGGIPAASVPAATTSTAGAVKKATTVAAASGTIGATYTTTEQATITNLQTQFNALLAALKTAGVVS